MPSVIAPIPEEVDELLDELVDGKGGPESREEAASKLIIWAAFNKYGIKSE